MTIKLTVEFQTFAEAAAFLLATAVKTESKPTGFKAVGVTLPVPVAAPPVVDIAEAPAPTQQPAAPKVPNAPIQDVAKVEAEIAAPAQYPATLDGIRAALRDVFNKKGATVATKIMKGVGATGVSSVAKENYAAFIQACQKAQQA